MEAPAWIYSNAGFPPDKVRLFEKLENALGFKLFYWQKYYICCGEQRQTGLTTAKILRDLLSSVGKITIRKSESKRESIYNQKLIEMHKMLTDKGIPLAPLCFNSFE